MLNKIQYGACTVYTATDFPTLPAQPCLHLLELESKQHFSTLYTAPTQLDSEGAVRLVHTGGKGGLFSPWEGGIQGRRIHCKRLVYAGWKHVDHHSAAYRV